MNCSTAAHNKNPVGRAKFKVVGPSIVWAWPASTRIKGSLGQNALLIRNHYRIFAVATRFHSVNSTFNQTQPS